MPHTLSKSEFKLASNCYTKLKYKKKGYPKASDTDEFMELLAEGGYMVGKLATLLYPGGIDMNTDKTHSDDPYANTAAWLKEKNVVLFEAAFKTPDGRNIRVDILEKKGELINLIEVKAKSWNSHTYIFTARPRGSDKKNISAEFKPHLEDVTFQYAVIKELYPDCTIAPYLFLPDKAANTSMDGLNGMFSIAKAAAGYNGFKSFTVNFEEDPAQLAADGIMFKVDVSEFVNANLGTITNRAAEMLAYMNSDFDEKLAHRELDQKCKSCDYRLAKDEGEQNGYKDCWGAAGYHDDHFFNLYQFGNIFKGQDRRTFLMELIRQGKVTINDVPDDYFLTKEGQPSYNGRPFNQKKKVPEAFAPELKALAGPLKYPLCFIDFECSRMALPYHIHMRPYELVAYQWSCHIVRSADAEPEHFEYINTGDTFPNFKFLQTLYDCLAGAGTILIWSHYERTVLNDILSQYENYTANGLPGTELVTAEMIAWLQKWRGLDTDDYSWVCDMEKLCKKYYYHPDVKGRSSIKPTLPAVLNQTKDAAIIKWLREFGEGLDLYKEEDGKIQDPYYSLPPIDFENLGYGTSSGEEDEDESFGSDPDAYFVKNGGAAMRAYQDMMYGFAKNDAGKKEKIRKALLQYCKLDTLAMVIIWRYWKEKF